MIAVECYPDVEFILACGVNKNIISHNGLQVGGSDGKGVVINYVLQNDCAIGIIDRDNPKRRLPRDLKNYSEVCVSGDLCLMKRNDNLEKQIIIIKDGFEKWLYRRAKANNIAPESFNMPSRPIYLHKFDRYERLPEFRFKEFLVALIAVDSEIKQLKTWLEPFAG